MTPPPVARLAGSVSTFGGATGGGVTPLMLRPGPLGLLPGRAAAGRPPIGSGTSLGPDGLRCGRLNKVREMKVTDAVFSLEDRIGPPAAGRRQVVG